MLKLNRGSTLVEVLIAVVLLGIITVAGMDVFSTARRSNFIANRYMQADDLSMTLMEEAHNIYYDDFKDMDTEKQDYVNTWYLDTDSQYCRLKLPEPLVGQKKWTFNWINADNHDEGIELTMNGIRGARSLLNAKITMNVKEYEEDYNQAEFPELDTITNSNTAIVDIIGATNVYQRIDGEYMANYTTAFTDSLKYFYTDPNSNTSYDAMAVKEFSTLNYNYVFKKWEDACEEIDEWNEEHEDAEPRGYPILGEDEGFTFASDNYIKRHLKKVTTLTLRNNSLFTILSGEVSYILQQRNQSGGWDAIIEDETPHSNDARTRTFQIYNATKYLDLKNIYVTYVPLNAEIWLTNNTNGSRENVDILVINNELDMEEPVTLNFYIVAQPIDNTGTPLTEATVTSGGQFLYTPPKVSVQVKDTENMNMIFYTNTTLQNSDLAVEGYTITTLASNKVHLLESKYSRLASIKIEIRDGNTNALYSVKESNILQ